MPRSLLKVTVLALSAIWIYQVAAKALTHAQLGQATNDQTARQGIDIFHDPLPPGALARLGTIRLRVPLENGIYSLAFSSDGKFLASGEGKGAIDLWEVPSGKLIRQWRPHESIV